MDRGWIFSIAMTCAGLAFITDKTPPSGPNPAQIQAGARWVNECRLTEENIDPGLFRFAKNRLQCGDVVVNIDRADYERDIRAWKKSLTAEPAQSTQ
ncbi:hypothetical protein AZH90_004313 [Salmonella enterica subsp. enterica serovar Legon]|nr:hypothetical protein [Salmonella enterica subsp. enterica serovar Legon]EDW9825379.1 hypothetical protein [Salmonella enterica]EDZ3589430.1 hypothetical protein [Salmonella enterica subsp. enterica serovar Wagenia]